MLHTCFAYIIILCVKPHVLALFIYHIIDIEPFNMQLGVGYFGFYTAHRLNYIGHSVEIDRCIVCDIKAEKLIQRLDGKLRSAGRICGIYFSVSCLTVFAFNGHKAVAHYRHQLYIVIELVHTEYHYRVAQS